MTSTAAQLTVIAHGQTCSRNQKEYKKIMYRKTETTGHFFLRSIKHPKDHNLHPVGCVAMRRETASDGTLGVRIAVSLLAKGDEFRKDMGSLKAYARLDSQHNSVFIPRDSKADFLVVLRSISANLCKRLLQNWSNGFNFTDHQRHFDNLVESLTKS